MAVSVDIEKKLHGFTLKVKLESDGSPMGILGASGSGKSMTLRCIAGIQTPDSGRIWSDRSLGNRAISRLCMADFVFCPVIFRLCMAVPKVKNRKNVPPKWVFRMMVCHI